MVRNCFQCRHCVHLPLLDRFLNGHFMGYRQVARCDLTGMLVGDGMLALSCKYNKMESEQESVTVTNESVSVKKLPNLNIKPLSL